MITWSHAAMLSW